MIYFIEAVGLNLIKIGWSRNRVEHRMDALQTACPCELKLLAQKSGGFFEERQVHAKFQNLRVRGEWFKADLSLREFVATLHGTTHVEWRPETEKEKCFRKKRFLGYLSSKDIAEIFQTKRTMVHRMRHLGMPHLGSNGCYYFSGDDVLAWANSRQMTDFLGEKAATEKKWNEWRPA